MALSTLYNIPVEESDFDVFSFSNMDEHNKIAMILTTTYSVTVPSYCLDPLPLKDMGAWLQQHQILHNIINSVLPGADSNDLTSVDFTNKDQLTEWIWLHAQEHYQAAGKLGVP